MSYLRRNKIVQQDSNLDQQQKQQFQVEGLNYQVFHQYIENKFTDSKQFKFLNGNALNQNVYEFQISYQNQKWRKTSHMFNLIDNIVVQDNFLYLINYLKEVLEHSEFNQKLKQFLQFSDVQVNKKYLSCYVDKRSGGRHKRANCRERLTCCHQQFQRRYLTLTCEGICLSYEQFGEQSRIRDMILFDQSFQIHYGKKQTDQKYGIIFKNNTRNLLVRCYNEFEFVDLVVQTQIVFNQSQSVKKNPFDSFSPIRNRNFAKYFIDGHNYFDQLRQDIEAAKEEIFITDWWLSPELYLKRPSHENEKFRLDKLLQQKAIEGVKIYSIVYNEPKLALTINSQYTQTKLNNLHSNISVVRHPNSVIPMLWSHHEKIVVIDQQIAYIGGLDLCYGRYDTQSHPLFEEYKGQFPGCDYSNSRISDFRDVTNFKQSDINREETPRMPWHDVQIKIVGGSVRDVAKHFVQYWNFVLIDLTKKNEYSILQLQDNLESLNRWDRYKLKLSQISSRLEHFLLTKLHLSNENNQYQQQQTPESSLASPNINNQNVQIQLVQSQIQIQSNQSEEKQQYIKEDKQRTKSASFYMVKEGFQIEEDILNAMNKQSQIEDSNYLFQAKKRTPSFQQADKPQINNEKIKLDVRKTSKSGSCSIQILRSANKWSLGLSKNHTENSIQKAMIHLIQHSSYYIYIENQFFMTSLAGEPLLNPVGLAIVQRIKQAYYNQQQFHIMIVLPLLPGFEGEIDDNKANLMKLQLHYEYYSICRGGQSLIEQLKDIPNISQYLTISGLRNHGVNSKGQPKTEIVYVHTKLMIVDDSKVLCGSANINDRSLKGSRDSEIAILIEDSIKIGEGRRFAYDLRRDLYNEHFHITDYRKPNDPDLVKQIQFQIRNNTILYRQIFACYPDDCVLTFKQLKQFKSSANLQSYFTLQHEIVGFGVEWPLEFLKEESLKLPVFAKEVLVPDINFT
ncbi:unnamed protein product [Paramecium pentaurelia]|uniref:Phospholipase n=1 Tax=Paramecium pentaurelia TaxID=43138 RepID=A0A8S1SQH0_9CILI|nr:unnamed protein product [Paramecium pentaurelia]